MKEDLKTVRIKMGICEYYFEYETLDDIKAHFFKNSTLYVGLDTIDNYGGNAKGERIPLNNLSIEHIKWAQESCNWGDRYLRGWKN